jgi:hypothetical protein
VWSGVDRLIDRAPSLGDLVAHRVELLAARRWRTLGRQIPDRLALAERKAAMRSLAVPTLLERVRAACDGPIVVLKGCEVAARYPDPALRPSVDLDLLVRDAEEVHRTLLAAGFRAVGDYPEMYRRDVHHLQPLLSPGLPLHVEIHRRPNWPKWLPQPPTQDLLAATCPSASGIEGVLGPHPAHHALLLAAHAWARAPLAFLRDVVDVAVMAEGLDRRELDLLATQWRIERVWRTTIAAVDALLLDKPLPPAVRIWARHLPQARDRTVLENHFQRWVSSFWALTPARAARASAAVLADELRPAYGERWGTKLARIGHAARGGFRSESEHAAALGREAFKLRNRWRERL